MTVRKSPAAIRYLLRAHKLTLCLGSIASKPAPFRSWRRFELDSFIDWVTIANGLFRVTRRRINTVQSWPTTGCILSCDHRERKLEIRIAGALIGFFGEA